MKNGRDNTSDSRKLKRIQGDRPTGRRSGELHAVSPKSGRSFRISREFTKVRGRFASLKPVMTKLPLEITLFEIFTRLEPRDLLALARTSKILREALMNRKAEGIWRVARENYDGGLPPLPTDLNEPQFARLIFDAHCHVCNKPYHCENVLWRFRLRCCRSCLKSFSEWSHLQVFAAPSVISEIAPKEMIAVGDRLLTVYDRRVVSEMIEHYMSLGCEEDRHAWVVQKQRDMQAIEQHACQCETWQTVKLERHARELQNMRDDRLQSILTRLEATGLSGEARCILSGRSNFEEASTLIKLCSLNKAKSLTNQGWDGMESALVRMLSEHKRRRVQHEDRKVCRRRCSQFKLVYRNILSGQDLRVPFPSVGDLLTDPILEAMIWDTPTAEELTPAWMRTRIMDELPRILYAWRRTQDERLLQILRGSRNGATLSDLCLATTIFGCTLCSARMIYPQVFYHRCCYKNRASDSRSHERLREMNELYDTVAQEGPWSSRSLFIHHSSSRLVERIIVGSGLDPSTTTTTDLTTAHPLIESESHPDGVPPGRLFVTWAGALTRILATQDGVLRGNRFGGESSTIRAKEPRDVFAVIHCAHCYKETNFYELSGHLSSVHDVHVISATSTVTEVHHHFNAHWYWSVLDDLNVIGRSFYYYPSTLC